MTVSYVSEGGPGTQPIGYRDNVSTDDYHYILEVDLVGKVIGGRFCTDSADRHIDFLWSPTGQWHPSNPNVDVAHVKEQLFSLLHHRFNVDVPGPDDLEIEGDFLDHEYVFRRGDRVVATISKKWFSFPETFGIEVYDGEDDILILACAVVVDEASERRHRHND